tara:strand:- start:8093 stop:8536 length:444 start_codon:yes stop_codon:yes gene_type:complete
MAAFSKFHSFVEALAEKVHNLGSDTLKVYLTNATPLTTHTVRKTNGGAQNGPEEIAAGNGYTAGGNTAAVSTSAQTSGTYKLVLGDPATFTASGGSIGPFRYAVLYNDTATNDELIGFWDYGSAITLAAGESFAVDFDAGTGVLTLA